MKRRALALILVSSLLAFAAFAFTPKLVSAVPPPLLSFGGTNLFSIPCTCSDAFWAFYAPLFLSSAPMGGPLSYVPGASWLFANYIPPIESEAGYEGAFFPGVPACWMYAGVTCFPMYDLGVITFTGTGLPGSGYAK